MHYFPGTAYRVGLSATGMQRLALCSPTPRWLRASAHKQLSAPVQNPSGLKLRLLKPIAGLATHNHTCILAEISQVVGALCVEVCNVAIAVHASLHGIGVVHICMSCHATPVTAWLTGCCVLGLRMQTCKNPLQPTNLRNRSCSTGHATSACFGQPTWVPPKSLIAVHHIALHDTPAAVQRAHTVQGVCAEAAVPEQGGLKVDAVVHVAHPASSSTECRESGQHQEDGTQTSMLPGALSILTVRSPPKNSKKTVRSLTWG